MIYQIKNKIREISNSNKLIRKMYLDMNKTKSRLLSKMSDKNFAKIKYRENTGESLNLDDPITFNEKLWWLKLNNRNPLLTVCSDKVKVREYVKKCGLEHILIKSYGTFDNAEEIDFNKLPDRCFLKCNHGSGTNVIYDRNRNFEREKFVTIFNGALKKNYYFQSREWNYKNIEPRIIIEEVLEDNKAGGLVDFKFMCFDGKVKLVFAEIGISSDTGGHNPYSKRNVYDVNFDLINMKFGRKTFDYNLVKKPENYNKMLEYAEILAEPFPHCRVDLYNIKGIIYFGEITFYHGGGTQRCKPKEWEYKLGDWIDLNSERIVKLEN